jgi:hypothetical protein
MKKHVIALFVLCGSLLGCEQQSGTDTSECVSESECVEICAGRAAAMSPDAEVQSSQCNPDMCACGIVNAGICYAEGSVIGEKEIACPASADVIADLVESTLEERREDSGTSGGQEG